MMDTVKHSLITTETSKYKNIKKKFIYKKKLNNDKKNVS